MENCQGIPLNKWFEVLFKHGFYFSLGNFVLVDCIWGYSYTSRKAWKKLIFRNFYFIIYPNGIEISYKILPLCYSPD